MHFQKGMSTLHAQQPLQGVTIFQCQRAAWFCCGCIYNESLQHHQQQASQATEMYLQIG